MALSSGDVLKALDWARTLESRISLSLSPAQRAFARNWRIDSLDLLYRGERGAAAFQATILVKKLSAWRLIA